MTSGYNPRRASNNSQHPGTLQRLLRALETPYKPIQGTCPGCTAAQVTDDWKRAAAGNPQDALYEELSQRWAGVEVAHAGHTTKWRKPESRYNNE